MSENCSELDKVSIFGGPPVSCFEAIVAKKTAPLLCLCESRAMVGKGGVAALCYLRNQQAWRKNL